MEGRVDSHDDQEFDCFENIDIRVERTSGGIGCFAVFVSMEVVSSECPPVLRQRQLLLLCNELIMARLGLQVQGLGSLKGNSCRHPLTHVVGHWWLHLADLLAFDGGKTSTSGTSR